MVQRKHLDGTGREEENTPGTIDPGGKERLSQGGHRDNIVCL